MLKPFALNQFSRYELPSQLIDKACEIAAEEGVISRVLLKKFSTGVVEAEEEKISPNNLLDIAMRLRSTPENEKRDMFKQLLAKAKLTEDEQEQLGKLMEILVPVLKRQANSVEERRQPNSSAGRNLLKIISSPVSEKGKTKKTLSA